MSLLPKMTQSTVNSLARRRRSVRKFRPETVPMETILNVLDTAHYAPSGANEQPWRFLVIIDPELKKDPGAGFPWINFQNDIGWKNATISI